MPDLKLSLNLAGDSTGKTVKADWTFNQALDGVTGSFVRIDWGDGTITPCATGVLSATHQYSIAYETEVYVKLLGNDVTVSRRILAAPGHTPPFYNPDEGNVHTVSPQKDVWDRALDDAEKVLPATSPWIGADNAKGLKPVGR
jgi:hypothetical protein